ncbi:CRPV-388 [Crowpox virus]|nr:CRPV-388 [Crowpox virus]
MMEDILIYFDIYLYLAIEARRPKLVEILLNQKICTDGYIDINRNYGPSRVNIITGNAIHNQ